MCEFELVSPTYTLSHEVSVLAPSAGNELVSKTTFSNNNVKTLIQVINRTLRKKLEKNKGVSSSDVTIEYSVYKNLYLSEISPNFHNTTLSLHTLHTMEVCYYLSEINDLFLFLLGIPQHTTYYSMTKKSSRNGEQ